MQNLPAPDLPSQHVGSPPQAGFQKCRHFRQNNMDLFCEHHLHHHHDHDAGNAPQWENPAGFIYSSFLTIICIIVHTIVTTNSWNSKSKMQGPQGWLVDMGSHWHCFVCAASTTISSTSLSWSSCLSCSPFSLISSRCQLFWVQLSMDQNDSSAFRWDVSRCFGSSCQPIWCHHVSPKKTSGLNLLNLLMRRAPLGTPWVLTQVPYADICWPHGVAFPTSTNLIQFATLCVVLTCWKGFIAINSSRSFWRPRFGNPLWLKMPLSVVHGCA